MSFPFKDLILQGVSSTSPDLNSLIASLRYKSRFYTTSIDVFVSFIYSSIYALDKLDRHHD